MDQHPFGMQCCRGPFTDFATSQVPANRCLTQMPKTASSDPKRDSENLSEVEKGLDGSECWDILAPLPQTWPACCSHVLDSQGGCTLTWSAFKKASKDFHLALVHSS